MDNEKRILELFSGTHSVGKVFQEKKYKVYSLDRDLDEFCPFGTNYKSNEHFKVDIMDFDYKKYPEGYFDVITASPVCLYWSLLRKCWIGRKCKKIHPTDIITKKHIEDDINKYGIPMVDKVIEIIEYFKPKYWWIENPQSGTMKNYIEKKYPKYNTFYDFDYCKYSDWGYKKTTRFWTNITGINAQRCKFDCDNFITIKTQKCTRRIHISSVGTNMNLNSVQKAIKNKDIIMYKKMDKKDLESKIPNRLEKYRIPEKLILELVEKIV